MGCNCQLYNGFIRVKKCDKTMQYAFFKVSFFLLPSIFALEGVFEHYEDNVCVANVQRQIFIPDYPIYYISDGGTPILVPGTNQYVIIDINRAINGSVTSPGNYILHVLNDKSLKKVLKKLTSNRIWNPKFSATEMYLILTTSPGIETTFKYLWKEGIYRIYIIHLNKEYSQIYTSDPYYRSNRCGKYCKQIFKTNCTQTIEPVKINRSFEECSMALIINDYYKKDCNSTDKRVIKFVLDELKNYLNLSMKLLNVTNNRLHKYDVVLKIVTDVANANMSEPIYVYIFVWVTFVNKISSLMLLQYIFKWEVWIMVGASSFATSLTWCLVNKLVTKRWNISDSLINVWALTLLGCIFRISQLRSLKSLILLYLLFIIVIQTAFKTNLVQVLTQDDERVNIKNIQDLAKSNRPLCMRKEFYSMHFREDRPSDILYTAIKKRIIQFRDPKTTLQQNYDSLIKDIYTYFVIAKGHHFRIILDRFMTSFIESGFYEYALQSEEINYDEETKETSQARTVLKMEHVFGIFALWAIGMFVSILAFIGEVLTSKLAHMN
ncbi:hypothetical protein FQA39_LY10012 [Lamprigera yunnana]|nr:hypothetical protein FQA39_LY10012 [Lamprigera yunnana]